MFPAWAKDPKIGYMKINARNESAADKPSVRAAMKDRRCLIPANSFYEWKREGKSKQPYLFVANLRKELGQHHCIALLTGIALAAAITISSTTISVASTAVSIPSAAVALAATIPVSTTVPVPTAVPISSATIAVASPAR